MGDGRKKQEDWGILSDSIYLHVKLTRIVTLLERKEWPAHKASAS